MKEDVNHHGISILQNDAYFRFQVI
jgi:hypothetical protein